MQFHDFALTLIAFFSEVIGTISGFGSSTFFVPSAIFLESFNFVLALTAILHCFGNISKLALFRRALNWSILLKLALPSIVLTGIGAYLSKSIPPDLFRKFLAISLIVMPFILFFTKNKGKKMPESIAIALSGLSGFSTGLVGTGGAIRGLVLSAIGIEKSSFVFLSSGIDLGGDVLRAIIYLRNGFMDWSQWYYLPLLGLAAFLGALTGHKILSRMNQRQFEFIVAGFILLSGLLMLF
jgi:uncharacterized membrane protein YfcA